LARYKTKLQSRQSKKKSFPIWLILTGAGLILVAVWALLSSNGREAANIEVTGAPAIKVEQDSFDYGTVKLGGSPIRTVVKVTNVGDQTLEITETPYIEVLEGC